MPFVYIKKTYSSATSTYVHKNIYMHIYIFFHCFFFRTNSLSPADLLPYPTMRASDDRSGPLVTCTGNTGRSPVLTEELVPVDWHGLPECR